MVIQYNRMSVIAKINAAIATDKKSKSQERLASGYRINRSADDAAGLAISQKMRGQIRGLNRASQNISDAVGLFQTADGALQEVNNILNRMRELCVQSANDTNTDSDRGHIQEEVSALNVEIDRIAHHTEIYGIHPLLLGGSGGQVAAGYLNKLTGCTTLENGRMLFNVEGAAFPIAGIWQNPDSFPYLHVKDSGGKEISFRLNETVAGLTKTKVSEDVENNLFVYSYDFNGIQFDIEQHWNIVDKSSGNEYKAYYEFSYNFINKSGAGLTFDCMFMMDMIVGESSNAIPVLDGTQYDESIKFSGSNIPSEIRFDNSLTINGAPTNVNVSAIFKGNGVVNQPDVVTSGDKTDIKDPGVLWRPDGILGNHKGDYYYGLGWTNRTVSAGDSLLINHFIGVSAPYDKSSGKNGDDEIWIQTGANCGNGLYVSACDATARGIGISGLDVSTQGNASNAIGLVDNAVLKILTYRTQFGSWQNRMLCANGVDEVMAENTTASESRIMDAKLADEMTQYSKPPSLF